jgi:hypothetical protein
MHIKYLLRNVNECHHFGDGVADGKIILNAIYPKERGFEGEGWIQLVQHEASGGLL